MKAGRIIPLAFALCLFATSAFAQYRWIDQTGQINYGDSPPADAREVHRIDMLRADARDASSSTPFELRRAMARFPVLLYSSDDCLPCDDGRALLKKRGVPYSERLVDSPEGTVELKRVTGTDKVPVLAVGRDVQAGFDALRWDRSLDAAGYPRDIAANPALTNPPPQPLVAQSPAAPGSKTTSP